MDTDEFDDIPAATNDVPPQDVLDDDFGHEEIAASVKDSSQTEDVAKPKKNFLELLYASGDISGRNHFFIEMTLLCLVGFCIWSYVYGKLSNRILAIKWISVHRDLFSEQFSLISAASNSDPNPDELLSQNNGYNSYKFYASGRKNCQALLSEVILLKRNDIFWRIIDALAFPYYDKVTTQVVLSDTANCHPVLFFLCRKGKQLSIRDNNPHFQEFTSQVTLPSLNSDLVVFAEVSDALDQLFSKEDVEVINDLVDFVEEISVTDLNTQVIEGVGNNIPPKKVLTCTFRLPAPGYMDRMVPLTELSLRLIDSLFSMKLSIGGKNKVDRNRKVLTDRVAKALTEKKLQEEKEENEKKKLEKLEREKQDYEKLPTHLKLKKDQKEEKKKKKEANKSMMRMKK